MSSILSEAEPLLSGAEIPQSPPQISPQTAGAWLRQARQQRGLHIGALAALLKVPQAKLEALESDRWKDLPDATFVRALATAMCRALKVDAAPVLALLPRGSEPELIVSRGLNRPYRERDSRAEGFSLALLQRPVVWGPALLLLAAAALYLAPAEWMERTPKASAESPSAQPITQDNAVLAPEPQLAASDTGSSVEATVLQAAAAPAASAASVLVAVAPSASQAALTSAPVLGAVPLVVKVTSESWVEVVDARGQTLLSKLLRPGDIHSLSGLPPLKVRIGNVTGTELQLRGSLVDLASQSRDNVARLELN